MLPDKINKSVATTSNSGVPSPLVHQVFYEENSQGFLEFFKRGSDDEADGEDLDVSISDSELTDPHPATSSDEHSSPVRNINFHEVMGRKCICNNFLADIYMVNRTK